MSATARAPRPDDDAPRPGPTRPRPARTTPPTARPATGDAPSAPAPVRGRAHSAPVRGATRARPVPRPAPAALPLPEPRRRTGAGTRTVGRAPFALLVVGLLVGTTLALLILNTAIAVNSLKATELRAENRERAQTLERLEQQVVTAGTPAGMAAAAAAAGLVPAGTAAYLVIGPDGSATMRGTPEPAEAPPVPPAAGD